MGLDYQLGAVYMSTPVTNSYSITPYINPAGFAPGRAAANQPASFQSALNRALSMRFNVSQPATTVPLSMGFNAPTAYRQATPGSMPSYASPAYPSTAYGGGGGAYSPLIPSSIIRGGGYAGYTPDPIYYGAQPGNYVLPTYGSSPVYTSPYVPSTPVIRPTQPSTPGRAPDDVAAAPIPPSNGRDDGGPVNSYSATEVGTIARAPMAMFEHKGELIISAITRNGINETPIWSYSESGGVQRRGRLPEQAESGHYGFSFGDGFHLTPESHGGPVDYVAYSPDGPYIKQDYSHLVPHSYKNLKWGFSYIDPASGRQFMGFGNAGHPGMVITFEGGEWKLFSAPGDMRFPTGLGVINGGVNDGTVLISSSYGGGKIHAVDPSGNTRTVKDLGDWSVLRVDQGNRIAYATTGRGEVYWASVDNLDHWQEVSSQKSSGDTPGKIEGFGEPMIHPQTGRMIFPAMSESQGATWFYEARMEGGQVVLHEVLRIDGAAAWAGKMATVGNELYYGTGRANGQASDRTEGVIYKINPS